MEQLNLTVELSSKSRVIASSGAFQIELMKQVNFDGRLVGELMEEEPLIESRLEGLIGSAYQQGEIEYLEGDKVAIAMAVKMSG